MHSKHNQSLEWPIPVAFEFRGLEESVASLLVPRGPRKAHLGSQECLCSSLFSASLSEKNKFFLRVTDSRLRGPSAALALIPWCVCESGEGARSIDAVTGILQLSYAWFRTHLCHTNFFLKNSNFSYMCSPEPVNILVIYLYIHMLQLSVVSKIYVYIA